MIPNQISIIIIFHKRLDHLQNVLKGLENGRELPEEVILIEMDYEKVKVPTSKLAIRHILITDFDLTNLPIAKARNIGAIHAKFETLAFLDVDCIPSYNYVADLRLFELNANALYMGRPMYLTDTLDNLENFEFTSQAILHPQRPNYEGVLQTSDYGLFWSLCFFMSSTLFFELRGFDENYSGYGAEDTDLAFECQSRKIPLILTTLTAYHQKHDFMRPPLKSLKSIVDNCNYFFSKWSIWAMANHLEKFKELGFIDWSIDDTKPISIIKIPEYADFDKLMIYDEPFA